MDQLFKSNILLPALAAFILVGCGSSTIKDDIQPSHLSKFSDEYNLPMNYSDFAANVLIRGYTNEKFLKLTINAQDVNVSDFSHMQVYIDADFNESSGLSMGVEPYRIIGADYMIEDNKLFEPISSTEWKWRYLCDINNTFCVGKRGKGEYRQTIVLEKESLVHLNTDFRKIRVSVEPIDEDWTDTNNYLPSQTVWLDDL